MTKPALAAFPSVTHSITQETIDRYAGLSGDFNPLHVDTEYAATTPFGGTVAHGPIALQTFFTAVTAWLGREDLPEGTEIGVTYRAATKPGDRITCTGVEFDLEHDPIVLEAECRNQRDETVIAVSARFPRSEHVPASAPVSHRDAKRDSGSSAR